MHTKRPHFIEVFQPDTSSDRLKIPSGFVKHIESRTSGFVSLVGPSDNIWHVDMIQHNNGLFLHDGWAVFVRDHGIECGDSLVFRYDGNLHFTVQIFDQSSCEKEAAFHAECSQDLGGMDEQLSNKRERENLAIPKDKIFEHVPKKMRGSSCQLAVFSNERNKCGSSSKDSLSLMPYQSKTCNGKPDSINSRDEDEFYSHARSCTSLLLTSVEKKVAQSFSSSFPNFVRIMKKFNISGSYTLKIPYKFSKEHLPECKIKIVLRNLKGDCWTVNSVPTTKVHTLHTFCGGWIAFVRGNNLKMGDICIFELVHKCEMRVHILGGGKEVTDGQSGKVMPNGFIPGCASTSQKNPEGLLKKSRGNSSRVHLKHMTKLGASGKKRSKTLLDIVTAEMKKIGSSSKSSARSASKACNEKNADELRSQAKSSISTISAEEEKAARSFTSSYPYFARFMKKFNISGSYTLKIPYQFSMAHIPKCKTEIILQNLKGECWTVNSVPDTMGRMVHTFCGGWMAFVRDNDVKMGDICVFELVGESEMRVHIFGVGRTGSEQQQSGKAASRLLLNGSSADNHIQSEIFEDAGL